MRHAHPMKDIYALNVLNEDLDHFRRYEWEHRKNQAGHPCNFANKREALFLPTGIVLLHSHQACHKMILKCQNFSIVTIFFLFDVYLSLIHNQINTFLKVDFIQWN